MKRIYTIIVMMLLVMPICLHTQTIAPRRPLALDSMNGQSTRKSLLQLREKIKENQNKKIGDNTHKKDHAQQNA